MSIQRPRPVLTAAGLSALITSAAGVIAFLGYAGTSSTLSGNAQALGSAALVLVNFAVHLVGATFAQSHVTPVADPRTSDGTPLVPVTQLAPLSAPVQLGPATVETLPPIVSFDDIPPPVDAPTPDLGPV